jgi:hypothetical protein
MIDGQTGCPEMGLIQSQMSATLIKNINVRQLFETG